MMNTGLRMMGTLRWVVVKGFIWHPMKPQAPGFPFTHHGLIGTYNVLTH